MTFGSGTGKSHSVNFSLRDILEEWPKDENYRMHRALDGHHVSCAWI